MKISSFPPIINKESKVLILGTVPGVKSWEMKQYYAHPQNQFWKIIFQLFNEEYTLDYETRKSVLLRNNLALWDVIDSCYREGSLDSAIRNEEANRIEELLHDFPNIKAIFCNGQKSFKNLQKIVSKDFHLPIYALPSTSPAYASMQYAIKFSKWKEILKYL